MLQSDALLAFLNTLTMGTPFSRVPLEMTPGPEKWWGPRTPGPGGNRRRRRKHIATTGWSKNGYPVYFCDNLGNSAPILTILSLLSAEIYGAQT